VCDVESKTPDITRSHLNLGVRRVTRSRARLWCCGQWSGWKWHVQLEPAPSCIQISAKDKGSAASWAAGGCAGRRAALVGVGEVSYFTSVHPGEW